MLAMNNWKSDDKKTVLFTIAPQNMKFLCALKDM